MSFELVASGAGRYASTHDNTLAAHGMWRRLASWSRIDPMLTRRLSLLLMPCLLLASTFPVQAAKILLLTAGDSSDNAMLKSVLESQGNTVTVGPTYTSFTGDGLSGYNAVLLSPSGPWSTADMPTTGQQALVNFVQGGGGLVTGEPVMTMLLAYPPGSQGDFKTLAQTFPAYYFGANTFNSPLVFSALTHDPVMNAGLPSTFGMNVMNPNAPTWESEAYIRPINWNSAVKNVTSFFSTNQWTDTPGSFQGSMGAGSGLVGGSVGAGRVVNMSTIPDVAALLDPNYDRLLANTVNWASQTSPGGNQPFPIPGPNPPVPIPEPTSLVVYSTLALTCLLAGRPKRTGKRSAA
jgi:hypothetical protein